MDARNRLKPLRFRKLFFKKEIAHFIRSRAFAAASFAVLKKTVPFASRGASFSERLVPAGSLQALLAFNFVSMTKSNPLSKKAGRRIFETSLFSF